MIRGGRNQRARAKNKRRVSPCIAGRPASAQAGVESSLSGPALCETPRPARGEACRRASFERFFRLCSRMPSSDISFNLMVSSHETRQRKRARAELLDEPEQQLEPKRRKADTALYSRQFWDTLSTITLTRRALAEFDRRIAAVTRRPTVGEVKPPAKSRILRSDSHPLREFASRGGPDLSELRGVGGS